MVRCNLVYISTENVVSFGVNTITTGWGASSGEITVSLWTGDTLYQCIFNGMSTGSQYDCSDDDWNITTNVCDDGSSDYKLVIDNSDSSNGVGIESAYLIMNDANYTMDAWCLPDADDIPAVDSQTEYSSNMCASGYTAYDDLCLDYQTSDCAPGTHH